MSLGTIVPRLMDASGASVGKVVEAYVAADLISDAPGLRRRILGAGVSANEEHALLLEIEEALEAGVLETLAGKPLDLTQLLAGIADRVQR